MEYFVSKEVDRPAYKRYTLQGGAISGYIVLEKCGSIWNLELMKVLPTGQGYGSRFLERVLHKEGLDPKLMTVCPTCDDSRRFFTKHGFIL